MFGALYAHHQEVKCTDAAFGLFGGRPLQMLTKNCEAFFSQPVHGKAIDLQQNTRCCINAIKILMMSM